MQCLQCQHENAVGAAYCDECGSPFEAPCAACGAANRRGANFCRRCGQRLVAPNGGPSQFALPESYNPEHLIQLLASKAVIEGERKQVTVLFADLRGSMELIADHDPEDARNILDPVLALIMDAVHRYEGTVNQLMGDGLMALFGAPIAHEDHAVRACHSALKIQESVERFAIDLRARSGMDVQLRVGLNSGEVVVRSIRNDLRMDYSAVGKTTHLAARMEQLARPGTILITDATLRSVEGLVDVKPLGAVPIKGLEQPIPVYELLAARHARTRFQTAAAAKNLSRFVGRAAELTILHNTLTRAYKGNGQIISLVGEPGIGKSRLAHEFGHSLRTDGWIYLEARSLSYGKQTPYLPLVSLLKSYFHLNLSDSILEIRKKVEERLRLLDHDIAHITPGILWLLDASHEDPDWSALDAVMRRQRVFDALKWLLLRQSQVRPLLIVFEDLQWIDLETQTALDVIVDMIPTVRILLLVTYRTEYDHRWTGRTYYTQVRVDPLPPETTEGFLDALLGLDLTLSSVKRILIERAEGNPFFLEESVRALVENGTLLGEQGAYRLVSPVNEVDIPRSVQAVLSARIDRLQPAEKEVLQAAAVVGKDVPLDILRLVAGGTTKELHRRLRTLQAAEFLYETRISPCEYTFKHSLTHDVAYAGLLQGHRTAIHAATVQAIEELYPERLAEHVEMLARHALRGELWEKSVKYLRQAGNAAAMRSAYRDAATWHRSAINALERLPTNSDRVALGIDLRFDLYGAILPQGDHGPVFEVLKEAEKLGACLGDKKRLARTHGYLAMAFWWTANYAEAIDVGQRAFASARTIGRRDLGAVGLVAKGWSHYSLGQFALARDVLEQVLQFAKEEPKRFTIYRGTPSLTVMAFSWLAFCDAEQGDFDRGLRYAEEAVRLAEEADQPWSRAAAYHSLGRLLTRRASVHDAITVLERGLRLCETCDIQSWHTTLAWGLGYAYSLGGDSGRGMALLEQAVREAAAASCLAHQSLRIGSLAEAKLLNGNVSSAIGLCQEALNLAQNHRERFAEGHILRVLGDAATNTGSDGAARALTLYKEALSIAEQLAMRPLQAQCEDALASLFSKYSLCKLQH
jgi:class 3 adenylate cyclase/tetratricopeptide (TPR) repeat protein